MQHENNAIVYCLDNEMNIARTKLYLATYSVCVSCWSRLMYSQKQKSCRLRCLSVTYYIHRVENFKCKYV